MGELGFEGEYLNGERNGKGKEYIRGILVFEGEYINGKKIGKGKQYYNYDGKLIFEGTYVYEFKLEGKLYMNKKLEFEGKFLYERKYDGKGYDKNGNIIYKLINGTGKVKEHFENGGSQFEGEYLNGKKMDWGKNIWMIS